MNQIDLHGKNAVVTGAARGIGFTIVERLLASGARCSLWDMDRKGLAAAADSLAAEDAVETVVVNVTTPEPVQAATEKTVKRCGPPDIPVNNPAIPAPAHKPRQFTTPYC